MFNTELGVARRKLDRKRRIPTSKPRHLIPSSWDDDQELDIPVQMTKEPQDEAKSRADEVGCKDKRVMVDQSKTPPPAKVNASQIPALGEESVELTLKNPRHWSNEEVKKYFKMQGLSEETINKAIGRANGAGVMNMNRVGIAVRVKVKTAIFIMNIIKHLRNVAKKLEMEEKTDEPIMNMQVNENDGQIQENSQDLNNHSVKENVCFYCRLPGHTINFCRNRIRKELRRKVPLPNRCLDYSYKDIEEMVEDDEEHHSKTLHSSSLSQTKLTSIETMEIEIVDFHCGENSPEIFSAQSSSSFPSAAENEVRNILHDHNYYQIVHPSILNTVSFK